MKVCCSGKEKGLCVNLCDYMYSFLFLSLYAGCGEQGLGCWHFFHAVDSFAQKKGSV